MPATYKEFAWSFTSEFLPTVYDTKVLCLWAQRGGCHWSKSDLQHLFRKCTHDKHYSNNLIFEADCKQTYPQFSQYEQGAGQGHDAGYDAFMTGLVFATSAKCIEIGKIVSKVPGYEHVNKAIEEEIGLSQTSSLSQGVGDGANVGSASLQSSSKSAINKRNRKTARKEQQLKDSNETVRKIKHFSSV